MKILAKHFLCKIFLCVNLFYSINLYADEFIDNYNFDEDVNWSSHINLANDIFEPINRPVFYFNDYIYNHILNPFTDFYTDYTPELVRNSFKNFFANLKYPSRVFSNILQFKIKEAYFESLKFGINSTVGIIGLNTPSDKFSFLNQIPDQNFEKVLAAWGVPQGPYIVVPILGPSTFRDLPAQIIDRKLNVIDVNSDNWDTVDSEWITLLNTAEILSINEEILPKYYNVKKTSIDFYSALRSAYLQQRDQAISE